MEAYYHPFRHEGTLTAEFAPTNPAYPCQDHPHHEEVTGSFIKGPPNTEQELPVQVKSAEWSTESGFMFLLENAWEDLYASAEISEFKGCEEG